MANRFPPDLPVNPSFEKALEAGGALSEQLARYDQLLRERAPEASEAYRDMIDRLVEAGAGSNAVRAGDALAPFVLPDETGRLVSSAALIAKGPLVISFNRGNWCPFCWLELKALQSVYNAVRDTGTTVLSITPEIALFNRRLKRRLSLNFPVLTDLDNGYALELGLMISATARVRNRYAKAGLDLARYQANPDWFLPIPATLVIDRSGVVRHAFVNLDFRKRFDPEAIPEILAGL